MQFWSGSPAGLMGSQVTIGRSRVDAPARLTSSNERYDPGLGIFASHERAVFSCQLLITTMRVS